jgi:serine/threonine protein kinase
LLSLISDNMVNLSIAHEEGTQIESPHLATRLKQYGLKIEFQVNRGSYGAVYKVKRTADTSWDSRAFALKIIEPDEFGIERLTEKGLSAQDLVAAEFLTPNQRFLIPRGIIQLGNGLEGILMPYYAEFADSHFGSRVNTTARRTQSKPKSKKEVFHFIADVMSGVHEFTKEKRKAHGDIKLENIAVETQYNSTHRNTTQNFRLGDFGSSYYSDWIVPGKPGVRIGDPTIRAPELFTNDLSVHPTKASDSWSIGALLYHAATGRELWEAVSEIDSSQPIAKIGQELEAFYSSNKFEEKLNTVIKKAPKFARPLLSDLLKINPDERAIINEELITKVRKLEAKYGFRSSLQQIGDKWGAAAGLTLLFSGAVSVALPAFYEGSEFFNPSQAQYIVVGKTTIEPTPHAEEIVYERALLTGSDVNDSLAYQTKMYMRDEALATVIAPNDETFRILWRALRFSTLSTGGLGFLENNIIQSEESQNKTYATVDRIALRLKKALAEQRAESKIIDVEDVVVRTFYGSARLNGARDITQSQNYAQYSQAMLPGEKRLLPKGLDRVVARTVDYMNSHFVSINPELAQKIVAYDKL